MVAVEMRGEGPAHLLAELGFAVRADGSELMGAATVVPEMHAPDTTVLRTSVLATWADMLCGLLAVRTISPKVPVTVDLDVHLSRPAPSDGPVEARARVAKAGRSVFVSAVEFVDAGGAFAWGAGTFMIAPDARLRMPATTTLDGGNPTRPTIRVPLAERAACRREGPGVAVQPRLEDGLNSSRTVNGGLIALAVEEACLSLAPASSLSSLSLRYLRPIRTGPARATAQVEGGLARVEVTDDGADQRVAVLASARFFEPE